VCLSHTPALFSAAPAGVGAFAAVLHVVTGALLCASVADPRAGFAQNRRQLASPRHERGTRSADFRAIDVDPDAASQFLHVFLGETCVRTVGTRPRTVVAGINTSFHC
jgi:hypothetical protein